MRQGKWGRAVIMVGALVALGLSSEGFAQEKEVAATGRPLYEDNCMVCHGHNAKGDGPMVTFGLLTVPAPDLTQLSKKNDGKFPFWKIYRIIDGRENMQVHGTSDMPMWGYEFHVDASGSTMQQTDVRGKILSLVYYLQSIQEK